MGSELLASQGVLAHILGMAVGDQQCEVVALGCRQWGKVFMGVEGCQRL
jgi:hypothetical protein